MALLVLILIFWFKLEKEAQKISEDFGFPRPRPYSRVRSWWTAAWFGPNVELGGSSKNSMGEVENDVVKRCDLAGEDNGIEAKTIWNNYLHATSWREKGWWIAFSMSVVGLLTGVGSLSFDLPSFPHRGELVLNAHRIFIVTNTAILWFTIFWASYEARACARLMDTLRKENHWWSPPPKEKKEGKFSESAEDLACYFDFRLIIRATQRVYLLIYLPFISLLFLVVARTGLFDAMDFPPFLLFISFLALCYAVYTQLVLHRCAIMTRAKVLKDLEEKRFKLETGCPLNRSDKKLKGTRMLPTHEYRERNEFTSSEE